MNGTDPSKPGLSDTIEAVPGFGETFTSDLQKMPKDSRNTHTTS